MSKPKGSKVLHYKAVNLFTKRDLKKILRIANEGKWKIDGVYTKMVLFKRVTYE